jgi:NAD(P)-dependent dehydrogenase (short-subunit alcohol dehydrogenase family)
MAGLFRLWQEKHHPPADPKDISFHGKTVLITGATSGLGFEASIKFLRQGVSSLIIGSRDHERGKKAKERLERLTGRSSGVIQVWPLDMSSFQSVAEFASRVNREVPTLDVAILNAGVMHRAYTLSQDGWEDTLQVNTLSTALLALLLLPKLQQSLPVLSSPSSASTPHLVIVSSGTAVRITAKDLPPSTSRAPLLSYMNQQQSPKTSGGPATRKRYAITKLLIEYVARHIAKELAQSSTTSTTNADGNLSVIVNTVKPGLCVSSLGREYASPKSSWYARWALGLFNVLFARSTEVGSRVLVSASVQGYESHGRMWKGDGYLEYVLPIEQGI